MKIELKEITIRFLTEDYLNDDENGVTGCKGALNIRPKYQREFVYNSKQQKSVIDTVRKGFPLNTMYWVKNNEGGYEVLDGQQRTISICEYVDGNFKVNNQAFHNLENDEQEQILNYKLMIYYCEGDDKEKLDWFETINIAGEKLTKQELRNAIYTGPWLTSAKKHFSKTGCPAYGLASNYLKGSSIRQEYLETAIKWISENKIENYMADHQVDANADKLWRYFQDVITWTKSTFKVYRKDIIGADLGLLYNKYNEEVIDADILEIEIKKLMEDEAVGSNKGIYTYVLTGEEKYLNIRGFNDKQKRKVYERQNGICVKCGKKFALNQMHADHVKPWSKGGKTEIDNCEMLCAKDNLAKGNKGAFVQGKELTLAEKITEAIVEFNRLEEKYFIAMRELYKPAKPFNTHPDIVYYFKGILRNKGFDRDISALANTASQIELAKNGASHRWEGKEATKLAAIIAGIVAIRSLELEKE